ncbi:hypothetical protein GCM10010358_69100 [Streptomyces minutiscleroticus]|uniref:Uncharacterized protein n=1 Tax=Streptomyces minutiscleroticus TaxID=68238 RepID=A0A918NY13_9ACTN|nr:hypothetical protein [Streptomyces minutiscleroticus]GGY05893.1 hypothetical protein GCM10010358_69100 [Streptomyces minutiscleroticus]
MRGRAAAVEDHSEQKRRLTEQAQEQAAARRAAADEPTHARLGRILVDLDLDFVLTSERLIGNWPGVPSLHIYACLRDPHVRGVATLHYTWNEGQRRLMPV